MITPPAALDAHVCGINSFAGEDVTVIDTDLLKASPVSFIIKLLISKFQGLYTITEGFHLSKYLGLTCFDTYIYVKWAE